MEADSGNVIHLVTEYNTATGSSLTATTVRNPDNFPAFVKWLYGYIQGLAGLMSNRSIKYHLNVTGKEIMRHTPANRMKAFLNAQWAASVGPEALSGIFQIGQMKDIDWETVDYWQSINAPMSISVTPNYMDPSDGSVKVGDPQTTTALLGIIFDEEAMGISDKSTWMNVTPFNARGGYYNQWYHVTVQTWNDLTENAVVLLLD